MALSTVDTFLVKGSGTPLAYAKIVCIKDYPDLGGTPSALETTTLCDHQQTFIEGLKSGEQLEFTANYTATDFSTVKALEGTEQDLGVFFGKTVTGTTETLGTDGKFTFKGFISVRLSGKGVDEVREMVIIVTPSTEISFSAN